MSEIKITQKKFDSVLSSADENTKKVLIELFGEKGNPSLDNYKTIKTYEDACKALGEDEQVFTRIDDDVKAYIMLKTISRALWGRKFRPIPDATGGRTYYYPWFILYTQEEIDNMDDDDRGALFSGHAYYGAGAGFGYLLTHGRSSLAYATYGFRLCQETSEKAMYFGKQFIRLWADYLLLNI